MNATMLEGRQRKSITNGPQVLYKCIGLEVLLEIFNSTPSSLPRSVK